MEGRFALGRRAYSRPCDHLWVGLLWRTNRRFLRLLEPNSLFRSESIGRPNRGAEGRTVDPCVYLGS